MSIKVDRGLGWWKDLNVYQRRPEGWVGGRISNQKNILCSLLKNKQYISTMQPVKYSIQQIQ